MNVRSGDSSDLIRRVLRVLRFAREILGALDRGVLAFADAGRSPGLGLADKVVAETSLLLHCTQPLRDLDREVAARMEEVASALIPHARSTAVVAGICGDPGHALDLAVPHAILSRLGHPDRSVDRLLGASLVPGPDFGPDRLPHGGLERRWLRELWSGSAHGESLRALARRSMLGRRLDVLGCDRLDVYAFTHAAMFTTDFGRRRAALPRRRAEIEADAHGALAFAIDTDDLDLVAEVLMTWPMLGLAWSPEATFAFGLLAKIEDETGFLPGRTFDRERYAALSGVEELRDRIATSYHTAYVWGFLCAIALAAGLPPPAEVPADLGAGSTSALRTLLPNGIGAPRWIGALDDLEDRQIAALAPLMVTVALRRAAGAGDLARVRTVLQVSLDQRLEGGTAVSQAAALLFRSGMLSEWLSARV